MTNKCIELITKQQPEIKNQVYWLGEQLKEIVTADAKSAEIVAIDLEQEGKGLADLEKKIAEYGNTNGGCTPWQEAEKIICEFYGLQPAAQKPEKPEFNLLDFM